MKEIPLANSDKVALIDDEDWLLVQNRTWRLRSNKRGIPESITAHTNCRGKSIHLLLHRVVMKPQAGVMIDHKNGDIFDNRKSNLRPCTNQENLFNQYKKRDSTFSKKGVHRQNSKAGKAGRRFEAHIKHNGKNFYLGCFDSEEDAAKAYDAKAKELFGEFACLNFPDQPTQNNETQMPMDSGELH